MLLGEEVWVEELEWVRGGAEQHCLCPQALDPWLVWDDAVSQSFCWNYCGRSYRF